jgi:threonine dehydratase
MHQRAFTTLSVERAQIEVVVQTRGDAHVQQMLHTLRAEGYRVERIG